MFLALLSSYLVFLVAVMSPGPDFAVTVRNSVKHGTRAGIFTALGIVGGNMVHILYINVGLGALIAHSIVAFNVMKFLAAAYLFYLGCMALRSKPRPGREEHIARGEAGIKDGKAFTQGFITSALNPKAALFWLSYFTIVLDPALPFAWLAGFIVLVLCTVFAWFSAVAWCLTRERVRRKFTQLGHWLDRATGAVLVALGVRVALASR